MKRKKTTQLPDEEDVPLNELLCINLRQLETFIVPDKINNLQAPSTAGHAYDSSELLEYSMETCKYCQAIFHTRYDHYVHLLQHLVIKVEQMNFIKCTTCKEPFMTQESLKQHKCVKRKPEKFSCKKLIVQVEDFGELVKRREESVTSKSPIANGVTNDEGCSNDHESVMFKTRMKLIDDIRNDILRSFVIKSPVVKCDDIAQLVKIDNSDKKLKGNQIDGKKVFNDAAVITKVNSVDNKANGVTGNTKKSGYYVTKRNHYDYDASTNTILIDDDTDSDTSEKIILGDLKSSTSNDESALKNKKEDNLRATKSHMEREEFIKRKRKKNNHADTTLNYIGKPKNLETSEVLLPQANVNKKIKNNKSTGDVENDTSLKPKDGEVTELFNCNTSNMRCRLVFEDDSDEDMMLLDQLQETNGTNSIFNAATKQFEKELQVSNKIMIGSKPDVNYRPPNEKAVHKSVHFDDLQKPGVYFCRYCSKAFPNKYLLICHEKHHMRIKQRRALACHICDRYIAGNHHSVRHHIQRSHPGEDVQQKPASHVCAKCGLKYYHYIKHLSNYHYIFNCDVCSKRFETEEERNKHFEEHVSTKTFIDNSGIDSYQHNFEEHLLSSGSYQRVGPNEVRKEVFKSAKPENLECKDSIAPDYNEGPTIMICTVCCMFLKNSFRNKYVVMGDYSRVGEKQTCEKCQKTHFAVKIVKTFSRKTGYNYKNVTMAPRAAKLKDIQRRFKKLNELTRF